MTIWYRAANNKNIEDVFSGDGGLYVPGRWHHKGRKVVYCSESISLCTLEWLAHNGLSVSNFNYHRFSIDIPLELIIQLKIADLPKDWNATPSTDKTRDFAENNLFKENKYLGIALPSVMVPEEFNLVINPTHNAYSKALKKIRYMGEYIAPVREKL